MRHVNARLRLSVPTNMYDLFICEPTYPNIDIATGVSRYLLTYVVIIYCLFDVKFCHILSFLTSEINALFNLNVPYQLFITYFTSQQTNKGDTDKNNQA